MGQCCCPGGNSTIAGRESLLRGHSDYDDLAPDVRSKYGLYHQKTKTVVSTSVKITRDERGQKYVNQYLMCGPVLGRGSCGKVKRALNTKDGLFYALKILNKAVMKKRTVILENGKISSQWQNVKKEIAIMRRLRHPTVVRLFEVLNDPYKDKIYLVMEFASKGSILDGELESEPICEEDARNNFRDIVMGVEYLHVNHVLHRDIKPENLLVGDDGFIKIADFGVSTEFGASDLLHTTAGSAAFMAPEMCQPQENFESFSGKLADVWSLGVTLFVFLFGRLPFRAPTVYEVWRNICEKALEFPDETGEDRVCVKVSRPCKDLLRRLLEKEPSNRITIAQIKLDAWVTNNGKEPMAEAYTKHPPRLPSPSTTNTNIATARDKASSTYGACDPVPGNSEPIQHGLDALDPNLDAYDLDANADIYDSDDAHGGWGSYGRGGLSSLHSRGVASGGQACYARPGTSVQGGAKRRPRTVSDSELDVLRMQNQVPAPILLQHRLALPDRANLPSRSLPFICNSPPEREG